jgi:hypothetical protein
MRKQGRKVVSIDLRRVARENFERTFEALGRECFLTNAVAVVTGLEDSAGTEGESNRAALIGRLLDRLKAQTVVLANYGGLNLSCTRPVVRFDWPVPDTSVRRQLWDAALGATSRVDASTLNRIAQRYRSGPGPIFNAVEVSRMLARARGESGPDESDITGAVRATTAERLGDLAQRIDVRQDWKDLVLAPDTLDQIYALTARIRFSHEVYEQWNFREKVARGLGVAAMFSGPPGTGKTMVAGLIARELGLDVYAVDLSKVLSKWIGETEKNLSRLFEATEAGHALLLFDDADSLFARRTEVRTSSDRYGNSEVNYLLHRIESYGGITILTTNFETSIDPALRRRLASHIVFAAPGTEQRAQLWRQMFPDAAPVSGEIDFHQLSIDYKQMTGAHIRNAVLSAAFLAAAEQSPISQSHLERAAKGEYVAMGYTLSRWWDPARG